MMQIIKKESLHIFTILSELDENDFLVLVNDFCRQNNYKFIDILDSDENENNKQYYVVQVSEDSR